MLHVYEVWADRTRQNQTETLCEAAFQHLIWKQLDIFQPRSQRQSWMFLKRRNQTSLARLLDVLLPTEPDVSARHQDVFNCFCGDKTGSIFIRTYTFLAAFLTSTIYFFNKTSGHFERRRGNWTGHFQLDLWRQNWAFFKRRLDICIFVCCDKNWYFYHHVGTFSGPICGDRTRYFKHHVKVFFCAQTWPDDEETSHTV